MTTSGDLGFAWAGQWRHHAGRMDHGGLQRLESADVYLGAGERGVDLLRRVHDDHVGHLARDRGPVGDP